MIRIVFSLLPFFVCLNWLLIYGIEYRHADSIKRVHTWFLMAATTLYLSHAHFFLLGANQLMEGLWILCSLSVYPLYYIYVNELTSGNRLSVRMFCALIPAMVTAIIVWSGMIRTGQMMHKVLFVIQVVYVCYYGMMKLRRFDNELKKAYADTEEFSTYTTCRLLFYFVCTSGCSVIFDLIGRQFFSESEWLVIVPSVLFSSMLFALSYTGFRLKHAAVQLNMELKDDAPLENPSSADDWMAEDNRLKNTLEQLMLEQKFFLQHDVKISDLAREAGTCRTYLSNYLNQELGLSFSDYINGQRIEYAKALINSAKRNYTQEELSAMSGFSSVTSFNRNFRKFAGMTTEEWQKSCHA